MELRKEWGVELLLGVWSVERGAVANGEGIYQCGSWH